VWSDADAGPTDQVLFEWDTIIVYVFMLLLTHVSLLWPILSYHFFFVCSEQMACLEDGNAINADQLSSILCKYACINH
jgi:hypothetical protein